MRNLLNTLGVWRPFRVLVVGDFMLDQLVYGNAERLTPEAPVPVLHVQRQEDRPGGASNVCLDLAAMHARVEAIGVAGADEGAGCLRALLERAGVAAGGVVADQSRPTTVKRSLIGMAQHRHPQRMFRMDHESTEPISAAVEDAVLDAFERALPGADVVCIEDYNKGVCTERVCQGVIKRCRAARNPRVACDGGPGRDTGLLEVSRGYGHHTESDGSGAGLRHEGGSGRTADGTLGTCGAAAGRPRP
jgi:D-beta-D-heptose 7-phosphate kinase/D-beta-D-heptose 1-phosphate adenosyltransferase